MEATAGFHCARGFLGLLGCNPNDSMQGKQHLTPWFVDETRKDGSHLPKATPATQAPAQAQAA